MVKDFAAAYGAKYPKAVAKITGDQDQPLFDFTAEHWAHLKTSNRSSPPSPRSGCGPRSLSDQAVAPQGWRWCFKLIDAASERWRYVNGPHLVALVGAGAKFEKGVLIERPGEAGTEVAA